VEILIERVKTGISLELAIKSADRLLNKPVEIALLLRKFLLLLGGDYDNRALWNCR